MKTKSHFLSYITSQKQQLKEELQNEVKTANQFKATGRKKTSPYKRTKIDPAQNQFSQERSGRV